MFAIDRIGTMTYHPIGNGQVGTIPPNHYLDDRKVVQEQNGLLV